MKLFKGLLLLISCVLLSSEAMAYSMPSLINGGYGGVPLNRPFYCEGLNMPCEGGQGDLFQISQYGGYWGIPGIGGMFLPNRGEYNMNGNNLNLYGQRGCMNPYDSMIPNASYYMPRWNCGGSRPTLKVSSSYKSKRSKRRRRSSGSDGGRSDSREVRSSTSGSYEPLPLPADEDGKDDGPISSVPPFDPVLTGLECPVMGVADPIIIIETKHQQCGGFGQLPIPDEDDSEGEGQVVHCEGSECDNNDDGLSEVRNIFANLEIGESCQPPARVEDNNFDPYFSAKINPQEDMQLMYRAACIYSANKAAGIPKNQFMRCDPKSKKLIRDKAICPSKKYIATMARSMELAAKCTGVDSDKLFSAMNHESGFNINVSAPDGENSTGLGQTFFSKAGGIADVVGTKRKGDIAKYLSNKPECSVIKSYYKEINETYIKDVNRNDKDTFRDSKCDFVSPKLGALKSSITTALYMRLLNDRYFEINVNNRIKDKKCAFEPLKNKKLRQQAKDAVYFLNYNKGPETVTVMLCDFMKYMKDRGFTVSAESFSKEERNSSNPQNFFGFLDTINEANKRGKTPLELEGFASAMKAKLPNWAGKSDGNGKKDSVPLVYTESLISDLENTRAKFNQINKNSGGIKCGSL